MLPSGMSRLRMGVKQIEPAWCIGSVSGVCHAATDRKTDEHVPREFSG